MYQLPADVDDVNLLKVKNKNSDDVPYRTKVQSEIQGFVSRRNQCGCLWQVWPLVNKRNVWEIFFIY